MKQSQIKELKTDQIRPKIEEIRKELVKLSGMSATGSAGKNPGQIKKNRKIIARLLTELRARGETING